MSTDRWPGHRLIPSKGADDPTDPGRLPLSEWHWRCECGRWESTTPKRGPYGRTTAKALISQVRMAHGKHARAAIAKATLSPATIGG